MGNSKEKNMVRALQAEIKAMQDANKDALSLIEKINKDTENITKDTENNLVKLREQIRKDLAELKSFSDPNIRKTTKLEPYDRDDKYGLKEGTEHQVIYPKITFGETEIKSFQSKWEYSKTKDTAIEDLAGAIYIDGVFADELKKYAVGKRGMDAFYRHWPAILVMAYEEMLKAYKGNATEGLKEALEKKTKALKRQMDIKAALMAELDE